MTPNLRDALLTELQCHGCSSTGMAPKQTMWLDAGALDDWDLGDLFDMLIRRRERLNRMVPAIGREVVKSSYEDVEVMIEAVKALLDQMTLP